MKYDTNTLTMVKKWLMGKLSVLTRSLANLES